MKTAPTGLLIALVLMAFAMSGCQTLPPSEAARLSPLQVRALQTRSYEGNDSHLVLKTVMNVLQDQGFLIDYGNTDLGLLHASVTISPNITDPWLASFSVLNDSRTPAVLGISSKIEATVNVTSIGDRAQVRVSFQKITTQSPYLYYSPGQTVGVTVTNPKCYQEFFARLEQGFFIQKQGL